MRVESPVLELTDAIVSCRGNWHRTWRSTHRLKKDESLWGKPGWLCEGPLLEHWDLPTATGSRIVATGSRIVLVLSNAPAKGAQRITVVPRQRLLLPEEDEYHQDHYLFREFFRWLKRAAGKFGTQTFWGWVEIVTDG